MEWAWGHILVMGWLHAEWQKNYSHTYRRNTGGVCGQVLSAAGHFINPLAVKPVCRQTNRGTREWLLCTAV
jgi:hypothetical protein